VLFPTFSYNVQVKEDERDMARNKYGEKRNSRRVLVGKPEGKRPLGRPRRIILN
jgi:hypothetical protein